MKRKLIIPKSTGKRIRSDGFIFKENRFRNGRVYEHWISPKAMKKAKKRKAKWEKRRRAKIKANPILLKKARQYAKIHMCKSRRENPIMHMLIRARARAKRLNLLISITTKDIKLPKICPVFGIYLKINSKRAEDSSPELDRIDNFGGYTKENIVVVSRRANRIKNNSTIEELGKLYKFYSKLRKKM